MNNLITIIVPIYKAEKYINKCIDSIINQTYTNLEIILVDDGSPDLCPQICDDYAKKDSRIIVIHKKNGGQASARNMALDIAKGAYIGFVDADDWICPDMFEKLLNALLKTKSDISICNFSMIDDYGKQQFWNTTHYDNKIYNNRTLLKELLNNRIVNEMFWNKLFRRNIIGNNRFIDGMIFEDTEMMHRCLRNARKAVYIHEALYYNYLSANSTTRSEVNPKKFDRIKANVNRISFYKKYYPELEIFANTAYVDVCLDLIDQSSYSTSCIKIRKETIGNLKSFLKKNKVVGSKKAILAKMSSYFPMPIFFCCIRMPYKFFGIVNKITKINHRGEL